MKLLPKIQKWLSSDGPWTTFTYTIPDDTFMSKTLLFDIFSQMNKRVASYMARRYIEQNRERLEQFVKHATVRRNIEREIRKLLEMKA